MSNSCNTSKTFVLICVRLSAKSTVPVCLVEPSVDIIIVQDDEMCVGAVLGSNVITGRCVNE